MIDKCLKFCYNWKQINMILAKKENAIKRICLSGRKLDLVCLVGIIC